MLLVVQACAVVLVDVLSLCSDHATKSCAHKPSERAGNGRYCQEPIFVPKADAREATSQVFDGNDGYILVNVTDLRVPGHETTCLEILDAADLQAGPLAVIDLGELVPPGLHGSWTDNYLAQTEHESLPWQNDIRSSL